MNLKKQFIVYSRSGKGLSLAWKLQCEGSDVLVCPFQNAFTGCLRYVPNISAGLALMPKAIVIFDEADINDTANRLMLNGTKVFGAGMSSSLSHGLENTPAVISDIFSKIKLNYIAKADNYIYLTSLVSNGDILGYPIISIESDRELSGNLGKIGNTQFCVAFGSNVKEPKIFQKTLKKLKALIKSSRYTGPLSIKCHIDRAGVLHGIAIIPYIKFPLIHAISNLINISLSEIIELITDGNVGDVKFLGTVSSVLFGKSNDKVVVLNNIDMTNCKYSPINMHYRNGEVYTTSHDMMYVSARDGNVLQECNLIEVDDKRYRIDVNSITKKQMQLLTYYKYIQGSALL